MQFAECTEFMLKPNLLTTVNAPMKEKLPMKCAKKNNPYTHKIRPLQAKEKR